MDELDGAEAKKHVVEQACTPWSMRMVVDDDDTPYVLQLPLDHSPRRFPRRCRCLLLLRRLDCEIERGVLRPHDVMLAHRAVVLEMRERVQAEVHPWDTRGWCRCRRR